MKLCSQGSFFTSNQQHACLAAAIVMDSDCADKPCKFQRREQLKELLDCARIVVSQNGGTEIAIDMSCGTVFIERVNDVFQARAIMHEKVYQSGCATTTTVTKHGIIFSGHRTKLAYMQRLNVKSAILSPLPIVLASIPLFFLLIAAQGPISTKQSSGCKVCFRSVIATEELIVKVLRVVDPVFGYSNMSHVPSEFLSLDDNLFDEIRRKSTTGMSPEHLQLVKEGQHMLALLDQRLGPQHVQMARKVPSELATGSTPSEISEVVRLYCADTCTLSVQCSTASRIVPEVCAC